MTALINQIQSRTVNDEYGVEGEAREIISKLPPASLRVADLVLDVLFSRQVFTMLRHFHFSDITAFFFPARGNREE